MEGKIAISRTTVKRKNLVEHIGRSKNEDVDGQSEGGLRYRCAPNKLCALANEFVHGSDKRRMIEELGFGELLSMKLTYLNRKLLKVLLNNFEEQTCTLHMGECTLTVTANDVTEILGLKSTGPEVECRELDGKVEEHLKSFWAKGGTKLSRLRELLVHGEVESPEHFKACVTLYFIGIFISPTADVEVPKNYLSVVRNVNNIGNLNWAKHLLNRLCDGISRWRSGDQLYVSGCVALLELFYYEKVRMGNVGALVVSQSIPRCGAWDQKKKRALMRKVKAAGGFEQWMASCHQVKHKSTSVGKAATELESIKDNADEARALRVEVASNNGNADEVRALKTEVASLRAWVDDKDKQIEEMRQTYGRKLDALKDGVANFKSRLDEALVQVKEDVISDVKKIIAESFIKFNTKVTENK